MVNEIMDALPCKPRLCYMERGADGYGFNLHGERGQHGQYIRAVDADSPAEISGLRSGDRVVEVNGVNIERETHSQVVARIREGGTKTCLLVVNKELDTHCRKHGITIKESMVEGSRSSSEMSPMLTNEDDDDLEVQMNGDVGEDATNNDEVIVSRIDNVVEAQPEQDEQEEDERREATPEPEEPMQEAVQPRYDEDVEDHGYAEIQRREEEQTEEEDERFVAAEAETGEARTAEMKGVSEEVIQPQENSIEESVPAPPQEREEEPDVNVPEPEPEPVLEAASVPMVESAPPPRPSEPEPVPEPVPEPEPVPVVEVPKKTEAPPRPVAAPTPSPVAAPTPGPTPEQQKSDMEKARILAAGRKKKKEASKSNWEDKYKTFNNL